jgi:ankyrin repeat protein
MRILLALLVTLVFAIPTPAMDRDAARAELARRGIEYDDEDEIARDATADRFVSLVGRGDLDALELFLSAGMDVDARDYIGQTALVEAVGLGNTDVALRLVELGADVNARDGEGRTPIIIAAHYGWLENVGWAREGYPEMRDALLAAGADPNARDQSGVTAMIEAAREGDHDTVAALLAHGGDPALAANDGTTPLGVAARGSNGEAARVLIEAGAPASWWRRLGYHAYRFARTEALWGPIVLVLLLALALVDKARPTPPKRHAVEHGDDLPRLAPIKCRKCAAPVPITPHEMKCPSCASDVVVPEDYVETLAMRARAEKGLRKAVRAWRRARLTASTPVILVLIAGGPVLLVASWLGALGLVGADSLSGAEITSTLMTGTTLGLAAFCAGFFLSESRDRLPVIPRVGLHVGEAEEVSCSLCGAPVEFAPGQLVTGCGYCGGEI